MPSIITSPGMHSGLIEDSQVDCTPPVLQEATEHAQVDRRDTIFQIKPNRGNVYLEVTLQAATEDDCYTSCVRIATA